MTRLRVLGIHLLAASALTLLWVFICPAYVVTGDVTTKKKVWHVVNGRYDYDHELYYVLDVGRFAAGEIVILSALAGIYFLIGTRMAEPSGRLNAPSAPLQERESP